MGLDTQQLLTSVGLVVAAAFLLLEALQLIQEAQPRGDDAPPVYRRADDGSRPGIRGGSASRSSSGGSDEPGYLEAA